MGQGAASWPTSMFSVFSGEALLRGGDMTKLGMLAAAGWGPDGREEWRWEAEKRPARPWAGVGTPGRPWTVFSCSPGSQDGWDCQ